MSAASGGGGGGGGSGHSGDGAAPAAPPALGYLPGRRIGSGSLAVARARVPPVTFRDAAVAGSRLQWTVDSTERLLNVMKDKGLHSATPAPSLLEPFILECLPYWEVPSEGEEVTRFYGFGAPNCPFADLLFFDVGSSCSRINRFLVSGLMGPFVFAPPLFFLTIPLHSLSPISCCPLEEPVWQCAGARPPAGKVWHAQELGQAPPHCG